MFLRSVPSPLHGTSHNILSNSSDRFPCFSGNNWKISIAVQKQKYLCSVCSYHERRAAKTFCLVSEQIWTIFVWIVGNHCSGYNALTRITVSPLALAKDTLETPARKDSKICPVFEPGAAHISNTFDYKQEFEGKKGTKWSDCTSNSRGGIMLTASCLQIFPWSFWAIKNWWKSCNSLEFFNAERDITECQPREFGYLN